MLHILIQVLLGLFVGLIARFLLPGPDPAGLVQTTLLGIVGGWLGGQLGRWLGMYKAGHPAGFGMSILGAVVLLLGYRLIQ